jgi:crotonobetainyl-CoA:carnitine CoA-transferase CaiB-like acyl-CoA transferase
MGADVIKIERPGGGDAARYRSASPFLISGGRNAFMALNRNKRSVIVNLKDDAGKAIIDRLLSSADVLIESFRPGVMESFGLGPERLTKEYPRLVYCRISGYGSKEGWESAPGQDLLVQSIAGLPLLNGRAGDPPTAIGPPVVDATAGGMAALAVMTGLYEREHSGLGQVVGVSLVAAALQLQIQEASLYLNSGVQPQRSASGVASPNFSGPYGIYRANDGYFALAHTVLPKLALMLNEPRLAKYDSATKAFEDRDSIFDILSTVFSEGSAADWVDRLRAGGFWAAKVQDYAAFFEEFGEDLTCCIPDPKGGCLTLVAPSIAMERTPLEAKSAPPELGADTVAVLGELGYDSAEIQSFMDSYRPNES